MQLEPKFFQEIRTIWLAARQRAYAQVNRVLLDAYWRIGERIVLEEQKGQDRAQYGAFLLRELATRLSTELGKGLDERELRRIRQFYQSFPNRDALRPDLSWTHYRILLRVEDPRARDYYMTEAATQGWGTRQLERNIQSAYYLRLIKNRLPQPAQPSVEPITPQDIIKDPYIMEFLGFDIPASFSENQLETAILSKLQHFLLEMGKGFAFIARQYQIKTETKEFYVDLVLYNYLLKCFVLIDLKITELTHQDIGQMDMYVRLWEDLKRVPTDNPTIGIILCAEKDATLVKYSVLDENKHLFASRYRLVLPSEQELIDEIEREKQLLGAPKVRD